MNDIISKFTNHLKNALTRALCLVVESKGDAISPLHLLWALSTQQGCVAAEILMKSGVDLEELRRQAGDNGNIPSQPTSNEKNIVPILSEEAKLVIEKAVLTANVYEHKYIGTEHLLSGLLQLSPKDVKTFFETSNVDVKSIQTNLASVFKTTASFPELPDAQKTVTDALQELEQFHLDDLETNTNEEESKTPAIDYFTDEMTTAEAVEDITPVVGREKEIARLTKILCRRQKNNPILVGEPGVGKTAIVEGLAKQLVEGSVPAALLGRRILRLDLAAMIAGTMYRGEFESRLRQLIDEVTDRPEIILFIDEVHTIMGAGAASGSLDAANILKPALARGHLRCIGATTPSEYKKHIETDGALERRFQSIPVAEPSSEETREILEGIKSFYEEFHGVFYTEAALDETIQLANRYFPNKHFPDKAIDILDEAGATSHIHRQARTLQPTEHEMKQDLEETREKKQKAVVEEQFTEAMKLKEREEELERMIEKKRSNKKPRAKKLTQDDILRVVAEMIEMPLSRLSQREQKHLKGLDTRLEQQVIGQNDAVKAVARAVQRAKLGLAKSHQPLASFLFVGPSGVGKTHLAKTLASELFESDEAFLRLDMSEYAEPYTISKLVGSPAGYVGYREATKLTDHVKNHPHAVVLFDEIEKAHPDVHNLLLQILDDGVLTDATGRKINFRNTIIILTTNAGRERFHASGLGFENDQTEDRLNADLRDKLEEIFKPELLNRINHTCIFSPLSQESLLNITKQELQKLSKRLAKNDLALNYTNGVVAELAKHVNPSLGARDIHRVIEQIVEHQIAERLLASTKSLQNLKLVRKKGGQIVVE